MNWPRPVRIVGVGSAQGDDAVAWQVVCQLRGRISPQSGVEFHLIGGGQDLLDLLDGRGTLVLVDAVVAGQPPGTIHRLTWPDPRFEILQPGSTHGLRPVESLRLAETLGLLPRCVMIRGIEGGSLALEQGFSQDVAAAVPALVEYLGEELRCTSPRGGKAKNNDA